MLKIVATVICTLTITLLSAQNESEFAYDKTGKLIYEKINFSLVKVPQLYTKEITDFEKNAGELMNYFLQNARLMKEKKGFDLHVRFSGLENFNEKDGRRILKNGQYGLKSEFIFSFEMFLKNGKKWTVEPPEWSFQINQTESGGHGGLYNDGDESSFLKQVFLVFPFVEEIAPGVHYYNCPAQTCGQLVVFNPTRPDYWVPVTVREIVNAKLKFYNTQKEADRAVYNFIKPLADAMSEEELNAPAYYGSEDAILNVNGKKQGLQLMRFNPDYWDKTLPVSAIQYFTIAYNKFGYNCFNENDWQQSKNEFYKNNGHVQFWQEIPRSIDLSALAKFIQKN